MDQQFIDACINDNINYVLEHYNCVDYDTFLYGFLHASRNNNIRSVAHMIGTKRLTWKDALFNSIECNTKIQHLVIDMYNESIQEIFELGCLTCLPHVIQKCASYISIDYDKGIEIIENKSEMGVDWKEETLKFVKLAKNNRDNYLKNRTNAQIINENKTIIINIKDLLD